jgi:hypothetical protein
MIIDPQLQRDQDHSFTIRKDPFNDSRHAERPICRSSPVLKRRTSLCPSDEIASGAFVENRDDAEFGGEVFVGWEEDGTERELGGVDSSDRSWVGGEVGAVAFAFDVGLLDKVDVPRSVAGPVAHRVSVQV